RGLLVFLLEGGMENAHEFLAHVLGQRAGRQVELDQNRLPVLDGVNEFPLRLFIGSRCQQTAHYAPLKRIGPPVIVRGGSPRNVLSRGCHHPSPPSPRAHDVATLICPLAGRAMPSFPPAPISSRAWGRSSGGCRACPADRTRTGRRA